MKFVKGFPSTMMDEYQLNVGNIIKYAAEIFGSREIVSRNLDDSLHRYNYAEAYELRDSQTLFQNLELKLEYISFL